MIAIATNLIVRPSSTTTITAATSSSSSSIASTSSITSATKNSHASFNHRSFIPMQHQDLDSKYISMNDKSLPYNNNNNNNNSNINYNSSNNSDNNNNNNNVSHYFNESFDFTQQSINWSERILQDIIGLLHILSPSGKVLYCSESSLELTGYSPYELVGKSLTDFIHVDDLDIFARNFHLAFTSLSRIKVHYRIRRKDNTYLLLESIGHPKQDTPDQPPQSFFAIAQPYLSRSNGLLDSFLELKMENEWLKKRLNDLLPYQQQQQQQQPPQQPQQPPQPPQPPQPNQLLHKQQRQQKQKQQQQQQNQQKQIQQQKQQQLVQQQQQLVQHQQQQQQQQQQQHQQSHQQSHPRQRPHQQPQQQPHHQSQQSQQPHHQQFQHLQTQTPYYSQSFYNNDILLAGNEPYFINHTSPQVQSRRPSSCNSSMFQANNNSLSMADDISNNHCNTPSIGSVELNEMLLRYNQDEEPNSGGITTTSSYLSSNNSATTTTTDVIRKDKWKRRKKHKGMDDYVCADCGTTASPEWRKGPHGPKTLCNACGLRWAKKNKKI